jgi:hypothetical protein
MLTARFKGNIRNGKVIQCYAPTEGTQIDKKQAFYSQLSRAVIDSNKRDIEIVMGDLNAKVRTENEGLEHVMKRHGKNGIKENGEMFTDFCASQKLTIAGTLFIHKNTCVSPNLRTENQIHHIAVSRSFRRSLLDSHKKRSRYW